MTDWVATGEREVSPYQILASTAYYAIEKAEQTEEGSTLEVLTAMLLAPMMVEAVLNHVGAELFAAELWKTVEFARPEEKLKIICERIKFEPDMSRQPFQRFRPMFRFRNRLAHGRTEVVQAQFRYNPDEVFGSVRRSREFMPKWERECTLSNAKAYFEAARKITAALCEASGVRYPTDIASWTGSPPADKDH